MRGVTDFVVRALDESEFRDAHTVLRTALHGRPASDEAWEWIRPSLLPGRYFGAVADGSVVSSAYVFDSSVAVPGGAVVPMGGVSRVGVRPDHTRRGILTGMMRTMMADAQERGQVISGLIASEDSIYGRFGYGISAYRKAVQLRGARIRPDVPRSGRVRLVGPAEAKDLVPGIYERIGLHRPGMMSRPADWWPFYERSLREGSLLAVHSGADGDDGVVIYNVMDGTDYLAPHDGAVITVEDMQGADFGVLADLWRFLLEIDLVQEIRAADRPTDEPVELLLADPRTCRTVMVDDHLRLRLVDVAAALQARTYGDAEPVAVAVDDQFLPANSATYEVSPSGVVRTDKTPDMALDVSVLAMIYLGSAKPSALAAAGRIKVASPEALARADKLFASETIAWCGTGF
jgi:predicted acetyltransferase